MGSAQLFFSIFFLFFPSFYLLFFHKEGGGGYSQTRFILYCTKFDAFKIKSTPEILEQQEEKKIDYY